MELTKEITGIIFQTQSTFIVLLMVYGVYFRKKRQIHVKTMSAVIIWDILLILQIELSRGAIAKASDSMIKAPPSELLNIHIFLAVSTVILYGVMVFTGRKMLKGKIKLKPIHKLVGFTTVTARLLTYITSFFVVA